MGGAPPGRRSLGGNGPSSFGRSGHRMPPRARARRATAIMPHMARRAWQRGGADRRTTIHDPARHDRRESSFCVVSTTTLRQRRRSGRLGSAAGPAGTRGAWPSNAPSPRQLHARASPRLAFIGGLGFGCLVGAGRGAGVTQPASSSSPPSESPSRGDTQRRPLKGSRERQRQRGTGDRSRSPPAPVRASDRVRTHDNTTRASRRLLVASPPRI